MGGAAGPAPRGRVRVLVQLVPGGGFGHRGFVDVVPALAVVFAVGLDRLGRRQLAAAGGAMALATLVTVSLMAGYWRGSIDFIGTEGDVWWDHVVGAQSLFTVP